MKYTCPVCGYNKMEYLPADYAICPCCRTEFGVSDYSWTHDELRQAWIESGAKWRGVYIPMPRNWNVVEQLKNIGYNVTEADLKHIVPVDLPALEKKSA